MSTPTKPDVSVTAYIFVQDVATQLRIQAPLENGSVPVWIGRGTLFFRNVDEVARAATMLTDYCDKQVVR